MSIGLLLLLDDPETLRFFESGAGTVDDGAGTVDETSASSTVPAPGLLDFVAALSIELRDEFFTASARLPPTAIRSVPPMGVQVLRWLCCGCVAAVAVAVAVAVAAAAEGAVGWMKLPDCACGTLPIGAKGAYEPIGT